MFIDALFCPPFALNIIKKITLHNSLQQDAIVMAENLLQNSHRQYFAQQLYDQIEELKDMESSCQTPQYLQLETLQTTLNKWIS